MREGNQVLLSASLLPVKVFNTSNLYIQELKMIAGDKDNSASNIDACHSLKVTQASTMVEDNSHVSMLPGRENQKATDDIMIRRLKNRERQRRYRAKKRLEAEMNKSSLLEQQALLPTESQSSRYTINFEPQGVILPAGTGTLSDGAALKFEMRVYCGRKWKRDARQTHASKEPEQAGLPPVPAKAPLEVDSTTDRPLTGRRDWKADARTKMDVGSHDNGPNDESSS